MAPSSGHQVALLLAWAAHLLLCASSVRMKTTSGFNIVWGRTDEVTEYFTYISYGFLKTIRTMTSNPVYECSKECLRTPRCRSFVSSEWHSEVVDQSRVLIPGGIFCYLSSYDRCTTSLPALPIVIQKGYRTYEMRPSNAEDRVNTCYDICVAQRDCQQCGRPYCNGTSCAECKKRCWELDPRISGEVTIMDDLTQTATLHCQDEWQLLWQNKFFVYEGLENQVFKLMVKITYEDAEIRVSYFEGSSVSGNTLQVGEYMMTEDDAGNGWGAPFKRQEHFMEQSNCHKFFIDKIEPCYATGIQSYNDQTNQNVTKIKRGYPWKGMEQEHIKIIRTISLWITIP